MSLVLGIDEAGRGPAIGPMVLGAVLLDEQAVTALEASGLADSKSYGSGKKAKKIREELAHEVRARSLYCRVRVVGVRELDERVFASELNALEREVASVLIDASPTPSKILCDGERMFAPLTARYPNLQALNNGESAHAAVAAASILAKTTRDALFERIAQRYRADFGELRGGGYVNAATKAFLRAFVSKHGCLPPEARKSWPYEYLRDLIAEELDANKARKRR